MMISSRVYLIFVRSFVPLMIQSPLVSSHFEGRIPILVNLFLKSVSMASDWRG